MSRSRIVNLANFSQFTAINVLTDPGHIGGPVVIPGCLQLRLIWTQEDGKQAFNVLHARYAGGFPGSVALANALFNSLFTLWTSSTLRTFAPSTSTFAGIDFRDLSQANQPLISSNQAGGAGTSAGTAMPNEVAAVLTLRTAQVGPANRGRVFIPNWATSALGAGNVIAAGAVTALNNFAAGLLSNINANGMTMCIAHPARQAYVGSSGTSHPARAAGTVDVTSITTRDNHWDSQRRRGLK